MSSTFTYVKIPVDSNDPVLELSASKAGGLENDDLIKSARYFFSQQSKAAVPSCDIMALSIPLPGNNYRAVSMYCSDDSTVLAKMSENIRATKLVTACGHSLPQAIRGDVFLGRAYDNEEFEWERVDFLASDAEPTADWCRVARSAGGGGGHGGSANSLSGLVQQQLKVSNNMKGGGAPHVITTPPQSSKMYGMDGASPVTESWGSWTQNSSGEVELKFLYDENIRPKDCQIDFKRNQLSIVVQSETILKGVLFAAIVPDECTFTMELVKGGKKEISVTLVKAIEGTVWSFLTE